MIAHGAAAFLKERGSSTSSDVGPRARVRARGARIAKANLKTGSARVQELPEHHRHRPGTVTAKGPLGPFVISH